MVFSGPVASLAIDAFGQTRGEFGSGGLEVWIRVVAEHAPESHYPAESCVIRPIVARAHSPMPAIFRIPADRQLHKVPRQVACQIALRMIPGSDAIERLHVQNIARGTVKSELMTCHIGLAVPPGN